jgi:hypothetical protein
MFFDEIQYVPDWEIHLKNLVDHYSHVKFVASGSAAAALRVRSAESGAGRFTDFLLPPVTFYEYTLLLRADVDVRVSEAPGGHHLQWTNIQEINASFVNYLNFGGYPEVIFSDEMQRDPGRYVRSDIIEKVLLRDLPSLYGIHDVQELYSLFTTIAYNTANEISLDELSKNSGVAKNTIKRYLDYLESAFLVKIVHRVDRSGKKFRRANFFKVYLTNPCMRGALFAPLSADDEGVGSLVETGVFAQWFHATIPPLHYARWTDGEVDLVHLSPRELKPYQAVEVKWTDHHSTDLRQIKSLRSFLRDHQGCNAIATTRTYSGIIPIDQCTVLFLPTSVYCYYVGMQIIQAKQAGMKKLTVT